MCLREEHFYPSWTEKGKKQRKLKNLGWSIRGDTAYKIENGLIIELLLKHALKYQKKIEAISKLPDYK